MAISRTFSNWALKLHTKTAQSGGAVYIAGIQDQSVNLNLATGLEAGDGDIYASYGYLSEGAPVGNIQTLDVKSFLDACGINGMLIDSDVSHPGVVMYFQRNKQGATREIAASSLHLSWTIANGLLIPKNLTLPHRGAAKLSADIIARQDSSTAPMQISAVADLPAGVNPTIDEVFGVGPVSLNSTAILGKRDVSIDFGIQVDVEAGDGEVYPTFVTIRRVTPSITLQSVHSDVISTLTVDGAYYTASQVKVYARKKAEGGTFVADGTAQHMSFTLGKCRVEPSDAGPGLINIKITPWSTPGSVTPLTINTAVAIS